MKIQSKEKSRVVDVYWFSGLATIAFVVRFAYGNTRQVLIDHDSANYIIRAREIFEDGSLFAVFHMPGYPIWIGIWAHLLGGNYILGAKVASIVCGSLLAGAVYWVGVWLYGRSIGILAGLLVALNSALIEISTWELSEATYTLVIFVAIGVSIGAAKSGRVVLWAAAGVFFGSSYWVRPEGFFYIFLIPCIVIFLSLSKIRTFKARELFQGSVSFLLAASLFTVPYVLFVHNQLGIWTINGRTIWAALAYSGESQDRLQRERAIYGLSEDGSSVMFLGGGADVSMVKSFVTNLPDKVKDMLRNWRKTQDLLPAVVPFVLVLFSGIGLFRLRWKSEDRVAEYLLMGYLVPWVVIYPLYEIDYENLTPVVPVVTLWSSLGLVYGAHRFSGLLSHRRIRFLSAPSAYITIIVSLVALMELPAYSRPWRLDNFYQGKGDSPVNREVAKWIRDNLPEDTVIMARKAFIAAYAGRKMVVLPYAEYDDVIEYARRNKVDVMIMNERFKPLRPQLSALYDSRLSEDYPDLVPIYQTTSKSGKNVIVYAIRPREDINVSGKATGSGSR